MPPISGGIEHFLMNERCQPITREASSHICIAIEASFARSQTRLLFTRVTIILLINRRISANCGRKLRSFVEKKKKKKDRNEREEDRW